MFGEKAMKPSLLGTRDDFGQDCMGFRRNDVICREIREKGD
jgi:hypothetical protein